MWKDIATAPHDPDIKIIIGTEHYAKSVRFVPLGGYYEDERVDAWVTTDGEDIPLVESTATMWCHMPGHESHTNASDPEDVDAAAAVQPAFDETADEDELDPEALADMEDNKPFVPGTYTVTWENVVSATARLYLESDAYEHVASAIDGSYGDEVNSIVGETENIYIDKS